MADVPRILEERVLRKSLLHAYIVVTPTWLRTTKEGIRQCLQHPTLYEEFHTALIMMNNFCKTMLALGPVEWFNTVVDNECVIDFINRYFHPTIAECSPPEELFHFKPVRKIRPTHVETSMDIDE